MAIITENPDEEKPPFITTQAAHVREMYPPDQMSIEIGRITVAAARVDRQLALVLIALKYPKKASDGSLEPEDFGALLKRNSSDLYKPLKARVQKYFVGDLLQQTMACLDEVQRRLEQRHAVAHSIWDPKSPHRFFKVGTLVALKTQEELDQLLDERGETAEWETLHPRTGTPGPQTIDDLATVRKELEEAHAWLEILRFTLASALFAGSPPGARCILSADDMYKME